MKKKVNLDIDLDPPQELPQKWTTDLNVKHKSINLLEDNIENPGDLGFNSEFLNTSPRTAHSFWKWCSSGFIQIANKGPWEKILRQEME